jgi:transposase-like protein
MKTNFTSVIQILDYYNDESKCIKLLEQQRWNGKPCCPHCGYDEKIYRTNRGYRCASKECGKKFSVTVGTIYENSKIKLRYWFAAIYLISAHKKGVSSHQLARDLGITQKSAWFVLHRVREMLKTGNEQPLSNMVEGDASYFGGKGKNRHAKKQEQIRLSGNNDKTMVFGLVERKGDVRTFIVTNESEDAVLPIIKANVKDGATVYTDDHKSFRKIKKNYSHDVIKHSLGEYVRGECHTNTIENFWSLFKRGIIGIYHHTSKEHLFRYANEFTYRYNTRGISDNDRFIGVLAKSNGRLKYRDLIA